MKTEEKYTAEEIKEGVILALKTVYDPELPANVYDLGLIYKIEAEANGDVFIEMTLTSPNCPVSEELFGTVRERILRFAKGSKKVEVQLTWDPPWNYAMMSEAAKLQLNMFY